MREIDLPFNKKVILHLCADIGSDSRYYQLSDDYHVIMIGEKIGVENYTPPNNIHGIIANPVCTEFSTAKGFHKENDLEKYSPSDISVNAPPSISHASSRLTPP